MARATISIPADMLADAREFELNLSRHVQESLGAELAQRKAERWQKDNKEAIDAYNAHVREHGCLLKDQGTW